MEANILQWFTTQRVAGLRVTTYELQVKTATLLKERAAQSRAPNTEFKVSNGWVSRFLRRHHLCLRSATKSCSKLPAELSDRMTSFHMYII